MAYKGLERFSKRVATSVETVTESKINTWLEENELVYRKEKNIQDLQKAYGYAVKKAKKDSELKLKLFKEQLEEKVLKSVN